MDSRGHKVLVILGCRFRHLAKVKAKVADLAEELVLVDKPLLARAAGDIGINVEHGNALKLIATFDDRHVVGVTDKLRIVILNHRRTDLVGTAWEVDNGAL